MNKPVIEEFCPTSSGRTVKKVTVQQLIKQAIQTTEGDTNFVFGCEEELHDSSWYGLQRVSIMDCQHLCFGRWGDKCLDLVCIDETSEEEIQDIIGKAIKKVMKYNGDEIWMEVV